MRSGLGQRKRRGRLGWTCRKVRTEQYQRESQQHAACDLVASGRHPIHVLEAARIGAEVMTAPPAVIRQLSKHVLTDKGIEGFMADWAKTGQSIL